MEEGRGRREGEGKRIRGGGEKGKRMRSRKRRGRRGGEEVEKGEEEDKGWRGEGEEDEM